MAHIHTPIPALKLNDGKSVPMLGYGTGTAWYKKGDEAQLDQNLVDTLMTAIKLEYWHLDGAEMYKTENELGKAIQESGVERSKLFVTTKVQHNVADIQNALKTSLKKLQLDYVDLYLIHSPFKLKSDEEIQNAWKDMEALHAAGLAKSIGVSNFLVNHLEVIKKIAKVPVAVNQIEFHPYLQHAELLDYHKKNNIATEAYAPLTAVTKATPGPCDEFVSALATKYAVAPAEIYLRWCIDQDIIPITTTSKEQRMSDFLRATKFKLTPTEVQKISELGRQKHFRGFWTHIYDENDRS